MVNNGFREDGILAIAEGLLSCPDLRHLSLRDSTAHNFDGKNSRRGWHVLADVVRKSAALEFLDLSDINLTSEGSSEILDALSSAPHLNLETILLENSDLNKSHYYRLKEVINENLPGLRLLDLALNGDLEDNDDLQEIIDNIEGKGGRVVVEEPEEEEDVQKDQQDKEREKRFVVSEAFEKHRVEDAKEDAEVDNLAEMIAGALKIEEKADNNSNS